MSSTYWLQSIRKNDTRNFCLFVCLRIYNNKSKFLFLETVQSSRNISYLRMSHFLRKMLVSLFSSNIPLYIGKNPVEKLCKVLEMELKTYSPVDLKFVFEKIKFKVLQYIQHNSIRQCPGLSKDQISMLKSLVINYFILKYCHTYKRWQIFILYVLLKLNYLKNRVETQNAERSYISHQEISNIL